MKVSAGEGHHGIITFTAHGSSGRFRRGQCRRSGGHVDGRHRRRHHGHRIVARRAGRWPGRRVRAGAAAASQLVRRLPGRPVPAGRHAAAARLRRHRRLYPVFSRVRHLRVRAVRGAAARPAHAADTPDRGVGRRAVPRRAHAGCPHRRHRPTGDGRAARGGVEHVRCGDNAARAARESRALHVSRLASGVPVRMRVHDVHDERGGRRGELCRGRGPSAGDGAPRDARLAVAGRRDVCADLRGRCRRLADSPGREPGSSRLR